MAAPTLHQATELHPQGRIKDGDLWFKYGWNDNGDTKARDFYLRYLNGLLIIEKDENNGGGRTIASPQYLANFSDLIFVQQSKDLIATDAQLASKGINTNGPLNQSATSKDIPFEIADATGKLAQKALPADAAAEIAKVTTTVQTLANNIAGGGGAANSGSGSGSGSGTTTPSTTRNVVGWVVIGALVIAGVIGVVALVKYMGKKKR